MTTTGCDGATVTAARRGTITAGDGFTVDDGADPVVSGLAVRACRGDAVVLGADGRGSLEDVTVDDQTVKVGPVRPVTVDGRPATDGGPGAGDRRGGEAHLRLGPVGRAAGEGSDHEDAQAVVGRDRRRASAHWNDRVDSGVVSVVVIAVVSDRGHRRVEVVPGHRRIDREVECLGAVARIVHLE